MAISVKAFLSVVEAWLASKSINTSFSRNEDDSFSADLDKADGSKPGIAETIQELRNLLRNSDFLKPSFNVEYKKEGDPKHLNNEGKPQRLNKERYTFTIRYFYNLLYNQDVIRNFIQWTNEYHVLFEGLVTRGEDVVTLDELKSGYEIPNPTKLYDGFKNIIINQLKKSTSNQFVYDECDKYSVGYKINMISTEEFSKYEFMIIRNELNKIFELGPDSHFFEHVCDKSNDRGRFRILQVYTLINRDKVAEKIRAMAILPFTFDSMSNSFIPYTNIYAPTNTLTYTPVTVYSIASQFAELFKPEPRKPKPDVMPMHQQTTALPTQAVSVKEEVDREDKSIWETSLFSESMKTMKNGDYIGVTSCESANLELPIRKKLLESKMPTLAHLIIPYILRHDTDPNFQNKIVISYLKGDEIRHIVVDALGEIAPEDGLKPQIIAQVRSVLSNFFSQLAKTTNETELDKLFQNLNKTFSMIGENIQNYRHSANKKADKR